MKELFTYIVLLQALLAPSISYACDCMQTNIADRFSNTENIYMAELRSATVVEHDNDNEWRYVEGTFQVVETYKGNPKPIMKLKTGIDFGACGIPMTVGRAYLIFQGNNEHIYTCGGTTTVNPYDKDELAKRLGIKPTSNK